MIYGTLDSDVREWKELRQEWNERHIAEASPVKVKGSQRCTFPAPSEWKKSEIPEDISYPERFNGSFCPDGFVEYHGEQCHTVLFIAKESNVYDNDQKALRIDNNIFWIKKNWAESNDYTKYIRYYVDVCKNNKLLSEPINIAYININKRGGFGSCNMTRLENYAKNYQDLLRKEIELIDPDIIICCSTAGIVKEYLLNGLCSSNKLRVYDCYHPKHRYPFKKFIKIT